MAISVPMLLPNPSSFFVERSKMEVCPMHSCHPSSFLQDQGYQPVLTAFYRKHLGEDILPYTCVLDDCSQPEQLYRTRKEWVEHMRAGHKSAQYWLCFACSEPTKFDEEAHFMLHLQNQHGDAISTDQIPIFVEDCVCTVPLALYSCPLCLPEAWADCDPEALMDHVAEHVHSFSLNSLPWQTPGSKEAEYLGVENIVHDDTEYFAVSSGPSARERSQSSTSYGRRRDIEVEDMPELSFQDENPEGTPHPSVCSRKFGEPAMLIFFLTSAMGSLGVGSCGVQATAEAIREPC